MKGKKIGILIGVSAVVVAVGASVTVTQQNEYKLIRQFGKVDRVISSSGISFKIPFIESTQSLPNAGGTEDPAENAFHSPIPPNLHW